VKRKHSVSEIRGRLPELLIENIDRKYFEDETGRINYTTGTMGRSGKLIEMFMRTTNRIVGEKIADIAISTDSPPYGIGVYRVQKTPSYKEIQTYLLKLKKASLISDNISIEELEQQVKKALAKESELEAKFSEHDKKDFINTTVLRLINQKIDRSDPVINSKSGL